MLIKKYKYLYYVISFLSLSLSEENRFQTECVEVPEGESRTITCPGNGTISSVDFDSYGLPQGSCQNYQQNDDCYCNPTTDWIGENQVDVLANDELCDNLPLELCAEEQNNRFVQVVCSNSLCLNKKMTYKQNLKF